MKKSILLFSLIIVLLNQSCTSSKRFNGLQDKFDKTQSALKESKKRNERLELYSDSLYSVIQNDSVRIYKLELYTAKTQNELKDLLHATREESLKYEQGYNELVRQFDKTNSNLQSEEKYKIDTVNQTTHKVNSGKVAFYCPREMYYKETYDSYGLIADVLSDNEIKSLVIKRIKEHTRDSTEVNFKNENFLIESIQFYDFIELKLDNSSNHGFDIVNVHENNKQIVSDKMENWHWKITPTTTNPQQQLVLKVIIYDEVGKIEDSFSKTYHLDIKIRPNAFFHNAKVLFVNNPEWTIGSILLPLLAFLFGRYQERKKRMKNHV